MQAHLDWGSIADWITAAVAVVASLIALFQLRAAAVSTRDQAQISRASLILEIDRDFESAEMQESRLAVRGLRNEIVAFVRQHSAAVHEEEIQGAINKQFSIYLNLLWNDFKQADRPVTTLTLQKILEDHLQKANSQPAVIQPHERAGLHYQRLTRLLGWMERVGHMANERLLPEGDIIRLYDFLFVDIGDLFLGHIKYRREDGPSRNADFMKETTNFRDHILDLRRRRAAKEKRREAKRGVSGFASSHSADQE